MKDIHDAVNRSLSGTPGFLISFGLLGYAAFLVWAAFNFDAAGKAALLVWAVLP